MSRELTISPQPRAHRASALLVGTLVALSMAGTQVQARTWHMGDKDAPNADTAKPAAEVVPAKPALVRWSATKSAQAPASLSLTDLDQVAAPKNPAAPADKSSAATAAAATQKKSSNEQISAPKGNMPPPLSLVEPGPASAAGAETQKNAPVTISSPNPAAPASSPAAQASHAATNFGPATPPSPHAAANSSLVAPNSSPPVTALTPRSAQTVSPVPSKTSQPESQPTNSTAKSSPATSTAQMSPASSTPQTSPVTSTAQPLPATSAAPTSPTSATSVPAPSTGTAPTSTAAKPPAAVSSGLPEWHKLQMRISGSMCIACLKELQENLQKLPGVDRVRVEKSQTNYFQPYSPDVSNWADGVVLYDSKRLPLDYLRDAIRQSGYHSYKIVDKSLDRTPDPKDLKF